MWRTGTGWKRDTRLRTWLFSAFMMLIAFFFPVELRAADEREFTPSVNDLGNTGLLQMPNARFHPDGELNVGVSRILPYTRGYLTLQGLPWAEGTFRYTDIGNVLFSNVESFSGDQSFKDRSVDLKVLMIEESKYFAQVAVLLRDLGGTDLFGSEFIVASRRYYNWDFTVGLAWGNAGSRGHLKNPFTILSDSFKTRGGSNGPGGVGIDFFRGERIAFFGGVEYVTPIDGLRLKLEYDGNNYQREPLGNRFDVESPWNIGVEYDVLSWFRLAAAFERGNEFMIRGNIRTNLNTDRGVPKRDDPPPRLPATPAKTATRPAKVVNMELPRGATQALSIDRLAVTLRRLELGVEGIGRDGTTATVRLATSTAPPSLETLANAALLIFRSDVDQPIATVAFVAAGATAAAPAARFDRADLERSLSLTGGPVALIEPLDPTWLAQFKAAPAANVAGVAASDAQSRQQIRRVANAIFGELAKQGFQGEHFDMQGRHATLYFRQAKFRNPAQAIGRAARAVARHTPADIEEISVVVTEKGVPVSRTTMFRHDLQNALEAKGSPEEIWRNTTVTDALPPDAETGVASDNAFPRFDWSVLPQMRNQIGGPDDFFLTQIYGRGSAEALLAPGLSVSGAIGVNIYNNFDTLELDSDSRLPRVRSDIARYLKEGEQWIDQLHIDYVSKLSPDLYGRVSGGIFELMFAGIGGEALYRPQGQRWALGLDVNYVRQRDFEGRFGFQDYEVLTGHLSYYHRLPYHEILATIRAGRYLAKDVGVTLEMSRTFDNGVSFGVFATKTDVSSEDFGEGSFDKGFFMSIPLDLFFDKSMRRRTGFSFRPVTRDGGQRLNIPKPLYNMSEGADFDRISRGWGDVLD